VNGDHRIDLLTVETPVALPPQLDPQGTSSSPRYRLYIADAQRRYGSSIEISAGPQPYIADVDGDGADDFLLMNDIRPNGFRTVATEVTVLRSNGDGTFERLTPFRIAPDSQINLDRRILAGDLNHDGLPDLVIRATRDLVNDAVERPHVRPNQRRQQNDLLEWCSRPSQLVGEQPLHRDGAAGALTEQVSRPRQMILESPEAGIERRDVVLERLDGGRFAARNPVARQIERQHREPPVEQKTDQMTIEPDVVVVAMDHHRAAGRVTRRP